MVAVVLYKIQINRFFQIALLQLTIILIKSKRMEVSNTLKSISNIWKCGLNSSLLLDSLHISTAITRFSLIILYQNNH
jgi:hypothetical protein